MEESALSNNVWLRIDHVQHRETWVRGDQVIALAVSTRAAYRDQPERYGVEATWFTHERKSETLTDGIKSRTEAMAVIRRVLQLLASPPDTVGLITVDQASVAFESMED
ncbi:hypothetical protein AB0C65_36510 [Nocardia sp. NPDC048505]|uniref:hypothetical protein n=1 Tax=Nocardia sp. NPDC048505 TaxID=3155756 RepID=UPI0033F4507E